MADQHIQSSRDGALRPESLDNNVNIVENFQRSQDTEYTKYRSDILLDTYNDMANQTSDSDRDVSLRPDNTFESIDQNVNRTESIQILQETEYRSEILLDTYSEIDNENYNDDEVFEDFQDQSLVTVREPRIRRISDVIDSIGLSPCSPGNKSTTFDFSERVWSETRDSSTAISCFRPNKEEPKYISLQNPPLGRASSATDGLLSPPTTPCSDTGYSSGQTPTLVCKPKWFRFSSSSNDMSISPPKLDMMDAQVMCQPNKDPPMESSSASASQGGVGVVLEAPLAVAEKHSMNYNSSHPKTGYAVIFNHEVFHDNVAPMRTGSKMDAQRLYNALTALGFIVEVHHDLDSENIKTKLNELAAMDHNDCDCVIVAVLSHGLSTNFIFSRDYPYPVEMLWTPFVPERCPTLAGKPKIFFIQACRGEKLDAGVHLKKRTQTDSDLNGYKIPRMADFLLAYSTTEGFYSWRNPLKGTWFIQCLCDVLENEAYDHDLYTLLLITARKVALDYESFSDLYSWQHEQRQVPQTVSTLIRKFFFTKKT